MYTFSMKTFLKVTGLVLLIVVVLGFFFGKKIADKYANNASQNQNTNEVASSKPVLLFYQNSNTDVYKTDPCDTASISFVVRNVSKDATPTDVLKLFLKGELTEDEKKAGFTTFFPLAGVTLESLSITNGIATVTMNDPNFQTSGGSCKVGILSTSIEKTIMQFDGITKVIFSPESLFQP